MKHCIRSVVHHVMLYLCSGGKCVVISTFLTGTSMIYRVPMCMLYVYFISSDSRNAVLLLAQSLTLYSALCVVLYHTITRVIDAKLLGEKSISCFSSPQNTPGPIFFLYLKL